MAAFLEQAGLNPVILIKEGHAWLGVWLVDSNFPNPVEDCAQDIRKRVASGELIMIETTAISQRASMKKAMADVQFYLEEQNEGSFQYAIDVKRARLNQIRAMRSDGATYHSAPTARDRDRLRQLVLEGLGWKIHRIWSTDWWFNREVPLSSLLGRLEQLKIEANSFSADQATINNS